MTSEQAQELINRMKGGWFSKWHPDRDVEAMWFEWLMRIPNAEDAQRAIVQHRADGGNIFEPKLGKCKEILATLTASTASGGERKSTPIIESIRQHLGMGGQSDVEVWIRYYRAVFTNKARARDSEQRPIWMQCYHQLASMGIPGMDGGGSWENSTAGRVAWMAVCDEHTYGFELADALRLCARQEVAA